MANPIDLYVGKRLRQRRCLLGMTQQQLASAVGIKFQQIQKYESGANRISASRLWALAKALDAPVSYFFEGLSDASHPNGGMHAMGGMASSEGDVFSNKETIDLVRAYYDLDERPRRKLLDLAKAMSGTA
ncbi:MAG: helix-turn-helix transcriptional regulator [Pseudomonadota bacterium]